MPWAKKILTAVKRVYPDNFRTRVTLLAISLVCISTILIGYLVEKQGTDILLQEKENKLFAFTHMLDLELGEAFTRQADSLPREEQIKRLNRALSPRIEQLLNHSPKVGVGYYHKKLDAIIVYAPEKENGDKVGVTIDKTHQGRQVMATGIPQVDEGEQVRGNIMNAMIPIIRHGEVLGYIWANELIDDIKQQTMALDKNVFMVCLIGIILSLFLTSLLSRRLSSDIDAIKEGLRGLQFDLNKKIPSLKGEMNEIVEGVNRLAFSLGEAKSLNELILESTIDGVITIDTNGIVTMLNPAAQKITGYTLNQVIGKPYQTIIDDESFQSPLLDTLHNGIDHIGVEVDFPVSGKVYKISSSTSHLRNRDNTIIGAVVIFKNLTEQREMQRIIDQAERLAAIGELMAGVAHEIRNPLAAVRGFVQCLQEESSQEEKDEFIAIILKEVDSINKVIQQLLDFSRPPKNFFTAASLNQLVHETLILLKSAKNSPRIEFILQLDENLQDIYVDKEMIKQVLLNLLINAMQAINGDGSVTITSKLSSNRQYQLINIRDTGCGVKEEIKNKMFTPFFTTKPAGTGLGLAIANKIISSHSGSLLINNHKDGGAIAEISLPVHGAVTESGEVSTCLTTES